MFLDISVSVVKVLGQPIIKYQSQIKKALGNTLNSVAIFTEGIKKLYIKLADKMDEVTKKSIKPVIQTLGDIWDDIVKDMVDRWEKDLNPMLGKMASKFEEVIDKKINPELDDLTTTFNETVREIIKLVNKLWEMLKPFISWLLTNIFDKIKFKITNLLETISQVVTEVLKIAKFFIKANKS